MKFILITLAFFFSYGSYAKPLHLEDGLYHAYWVYGETDNYKTSLLIASKEDKIGSDYYFLNKINDESNNEIYISVLNGDVLFFYKHDEIEGGPSIGWANATLSDNNLSIGSLTVKNFYDGTDGDADKSIRHKVGVKFTGNNRPTKEKEIIPLQQLASDKFKVDCTSYFTENIKTNNSKPPKDDPIKDYSKKILLNNNGLCNLILSPKADSQIVNGWILFKRLE